MTKKTKGHILALLTMMIWGTTFISTKILLNQFSAIEILWVRFMIGFFILWIIHPKRFKVNKTQEVTFILAGITGICLYYLLENIALIYTNASHVGVIISIAPFFTAILTRIIYKGEQTITKQFFIGFLIALSGIYLINLNGFQLSLNPLGDILALLAAFVWAVYSLLSKKISSYGYSIVLTTRKTFLYGIICMLPILFSKGDFHFDSFIHPIYLANFLYLGIGASALCFITWNYAIYSLGTIKSSIYIYTVPVITVLTSSLILNEKITLPIILGTILTLVGLIVSNYKNKEGKK